MFLSRNEKNNVYPCTSQFYNIKVGFKGEKLYRHVFMMSGLGDKIVPLKTFDKPLTCEYQTGSEQIQTDFNPKHFSIRYYSKITIFFFLTSDNLDDFQKR